MPNIVVVGAGVVGLTSALLLAKDKDNVITVVAKHMPGDYDIQYTSPWAGANCLPMATEENSRWERRTWPELRRLAVEVPEAGIHLQKALVYRAARDLDPKNKAKDGLSDALFAENPWYRTLFSDYRQVPANELPAGVIYGHEFGSVCINTPMYLAWLVGQCRKLGVEFKRASLSHILEAKALHHSLSSSSSSSSSKGPLPSPPPPIIIVNATGLLACQLGGVRDTKVTPARGQIVVVRNVSPAMYCISSCDDGPEELVYTMTRAAGGGTVLGGTYAKGNWEANPDPNIANRIMQRVVTAFPQLTGGRGVEGLEVIRHGVGLRPYREGGVRLEKERFVAEGKEEEGEEGEGTWVVHNYGHAGWGFQGSYGTAERVVELVNEIQGKALTKAEDKSRL